MNKERSGDMIKMAFLDDKALRDRITDEYVRLMDTKTLREHWLKVRKKYSELDGFDFSLKELLASPFESLVSIAKAFDSALVGVEDEKKKVIKNALSAEVFKYDSYYQRAKIAPFFKEHAEDLGLHSCHYCDMAYINVFEYIDRTQGHKRKVAHFDLDHVLEKSDYPMLAFSLFNLVPCCPICNERLKGARPLAKLEKMLRKFSPTCRDFDFDRKVSLELMPLGDVKRPFIENPSLYEVYFDCHKDKDYEKYIERFHLAERYNYHKSEALRLKDLQMRYPDTNIANIASMICVPFDVVKEDIFGLRFSEQHHRCFGKLKRDMLK